MSPERPSPQSPCISSKPYTRGLALSASSPEDPRDIAQVEYPHTPDLSESEGKPGFPTRAQYRTIEQGYIDSLTPRRQAKALISQALFDRIWDVLHSNDNTKENAQFRFWARKMFTLSTSHTMSLGINATQLMDQEVLLHDGLLVAVREQIYDLLCFCHGSTNHGGRDKTCALIRKHYTWVPKDLVAQFIKACPTCIMKKCGHSDVGLLSPRITAACVSPALPAPTMVPTEDKRDPALPTFRDYFNDVDGQDDSHSQDAYSIPGTPINSSHSQFTFNSEHMNGTPVDQLNAYNQYSSSNQNVLSGFPMMREVSLYRGIPDGWQYQDINYRNAHAECVEYQRVAQIMPYDPSLGRTRPRVPSIAPLFRSDFGDMIHAKAEDGELMATQEGSGHAMPPGAAQDYGGQAMSPTLGYPVHSPAVGSPDMQIDPLLLAFSNSMQHSGDGSPVLQRVALSTIHTEIATRVPGVGAMSGNTNGSGLRLNLGGLDSARTFQEFISMKENLGPGPADSKDGSRIGRRTSPGGESSGSSNNSPTSSVMSAASGLSLTAVTGSENSSPNTSAPVTPVDEAPDKARIVDMGHGVGQSELNAVIQAVSAFGVRT